MAKSGPKPIHPKLLKIKPGMWIAPWIYEHARDHGKSAGHAFEAAYLYFLDIDENELKQAYMVKHGIKE